MGERLEEIVVGEVVVDDYDAGYAVDEEADGVEAHVVGLFGDEHGLDEPRHQCQRVYSRDQVDITASPQLQLNRVHSIVVPHHRTQSTTILAHPLPLNLLENLNKLFLHPSVLMVLI